MSWEFVFLILAFIAAILGFGGVIGGEGAVMADISFVVFLALFLVAGLTKRRAPPI